MFDQQHQRNNTVLFCGLESENGCATDFIADSGRDIASDITTEIFFKELFSDLTEKEKKIVSDYFIMGKQVKETAEELGISTRQVSRDKNSALAKMLKRMKAAGYESYAEAAGAFLQESDYIPKGTLKQWHLEDMDKISKDKSVVLLDVRTVGEFNRGHMDGFRNIPVDELRERINEIEKGKPVYLICQSGLRSYIASRILEGNGYETYNFSGGFRFYDAVVNDRALIEKAYACGMDY